MRELHECGGGDGKATGASSMVDDARSSSRAHGRRRRNIWLQRELHGRGHELELSISMVMASTGTTWPRRRRERGNSWALARAARSTLGGASSMASRSRWVSMRMVARYGVAPNEDGSNAALR
jgi:hypothetical protein